MFVLTFKIKQFITLVCIVLNSHPHLNLQFYLWPSYTRSFVVIGFFSFRLHTNNYLKSIMKNNLCTNVWKVEILVRSQVLRTILQSYFIVSGFFSTFKKKSFCQQMSAALFFVSRLIHANFIDLNMFSFSKLHSL